MLYRELPFWCEAAGRLYANGPVRSSGKAERQVSLAVFPALMRTDMQVSLKPLGGKAVFYRPIAEIGLFLFAVIADNTLAPCITADL